MKATREKGCRGVWGNRWSPVLGGYRWPGAVPIESAVLRKIVRAELGST